MQNAILVPITGSQRYPKKVHWAVALEQEEGRQLTEEDDLGYAAAGPLSCCERCAYFALVGCGFLLLALLLSMLVYGIWYAVRRN
jgi:hypothetical protein